MWRSAREENNGFYEFNGFDPPNSGDPLFSCISGSVILALAQIYLMRSLATAERQQYLYVAQCPQP